MPFVHRVQNTITKYGLLSPGDRVLAGVSGGADSIALALALAEIGQPIAIAHLNHGLRGPASDEDERFVVEFAERLAVPVFTKRVEIGLAGGNLEAAGREARREFFESLMAEHGYGKVALAHNSRDRVETFLLHLLRGAGTEGLASMVPRTGATIRPLIEVSRAEIEDYLRFRSQSWRTDETNTDTRFARNRLRCEVIPELEALFNPKLVETLTRTIELLDAEDRWMRQMAQDWLAQSGVQRGSELHIDARALQSEPEALARRVIRAALRQLGSSLKDATFEHFENVRSLLQHGKSGKVIQIPGGIRAAREFDALVIRLEADSVMEFAYKLPIPGVVRIPELGQSFRAEIVDRFGDDTRRGRVFVDGESIGDYVNIRSWKPGDYYRPQGWPAGKLKKLFQRARIPRSQRSRWPVFVTGSAIVWVASFPVSREFAPSGRTQKIVAFEALPD
jgi:tRNA(Ile)-lysidine synthase